MARFCAACGSPVDPAQRACMQCGAALDSFVPPPPGAAAAGPAPGAGGFESTVRGYGDRVVGSLGLSSAGTSRGLIEMMIRAAFLDRRVYREAAADSNGNTNAVIALVIPAVAGMLGGWFLSSHYFFARGILILLVSAIIGIISVLVSIGAMAALSQAVVQRRLSFGQLFRPLAYAQSPGVLGIIPIIGAILGLWRIVTSLFAVQEVSGADMVKSAVLLLIGVVAAIIVGVILSPVILAALALRAL